MSANFQQSNINKNNVKSSNSSDKNSYSKITNRDKQNAQSKNSLYSREILTENTNSLKSPITNVISPNFNFTKIRSSTPLLSPRRPQSFNNQISDINHANKTSSNRITSCSETNGTPLFNNKKQLFAFEKSRRNSEFNHEQNSKINHNKNIIRNLNHKSNLVPPWENSTIKYNPLHVENETINDNFELASYRNSTSNVNNKKLDNIKRQDTFKELSSIQTWRSNLNNKIISPGLVKNKRSSSLNKKVENNLENIYSVTGQYKDFGTFPKIKLKKGNNALDSECESIGSNLSEITSDTSIKLAKKKVIKRNKNNFETHDFLTSTKFFNQSKNNFPNNKYEKHKQKLEFSDKLKENAIENLNSSPKRSVDVNELNQYKNYPRMLNSKNKKTHYYSQRPARRNIKYKTTVENNLSVNQKQRAAKYKTTPNSKTIQLGDNKKNSKNCSRYCTHRRQRRCHHYYHHHCLHRKNKSKRQNPKFKNKKRIKEKRLPQRKTVHRKKYLDSSFEQDEMNKIDKKREKSRKSIFSFKKLKSTKNLKHRNQSLDSDEYSSVFNSNSSITNFIILQNNNRNSEKLTKLKNTSSKEFYLVYKNKNYKVLDTDNAISRKHKPNKLKSSFNLHLNPTYMQQKLKLHKRNKTSHRRSQSLKELSSVESNRCESSNGLRSRSCLLKYKPKENLIINPIKKNTDKNNFIESTNKMNRITENPYLTRKKLQTYGNQSYYKKLINEHQSDDEDDDEEYYIKKKRKSNFKKTQKNLNKLRALSRNQKVKNKTKLNKLKSFLRDCSCSKRRKTTTDDYYDHAQVKYYKTRPKIIQANENNLNTPKQEQLLVKNTNLNEIKPTFSIERPKKIIYNPVELNQNKPINDFTYESTNIIFKSNNEPSEQSSTLIDKEVALTSPNKPKESLLNTRISRITADANNEFTTVTSFVQKSLNRKLEMTAKRQKMPFSSMFNKIDSSSRKDSLDYIDERLFINGDSDDYFSSADPRREKLDNYESTYSKEESAFVRNSSEISSSVEQDQNKHFYKFRNVNKPKSIKENDITIITSDLENSSSESQSEQFEIREIRGKSACENANNQIVLAEPKQSRFNLFNDQNERMDKNSSSYSSSKFFYFFYIDYFDIELEMCQYFIKNFN